MNPHLFSPRPGEPPLLGILPCLEVLLSVRLGDSLKALDEIWGSMTRPWDRRLRSSYDNLRWRGELKSSASADRAMAAAFGQMVHGPPRSPAERPIDWASCAFVDSPNGETLAVAGAYCTIGWPDGSGARGVSLRLTGSPEDETWAFLEKLTRGLAASAPPLWRWMTLGYRFVPVSPHSERLTDALTMMHQRSARFRAVDVGDLYGLYTSASVERLRSVGFLTVLSPALLARHQIDVTSARHPSIRAFSTGGALVIQAGNAPSLLDVNRRESMDAYRAADTFCGQARADLGMNFFAPWDEESTRQWLNRFRAESSEAARTSAGTRS